MKIQRFCRGKGSKKLEQTITTITKANGPRDSSPQRFRRAIWPGNTRDQLRWRSRCGQDGRGPKQARARRHGRRAYLGTAPNLLLCGAPFSDPARFVCETQILPGWRPALRGQVSRCTHGRTDTFFCLYSFQRWFQNYRIQFSFGSWTVRQPPPLCHSSRLRALAPTASPWWMNPFRFGSTNQQR